ncbi:MAG: nucleotidyltransferase domain-containing protein [Planctomycetota bacterium]|nr:nucleotidyltransferase domain-containing protein [Planctomycetota bacterium]MDA1137283.1 nucleotidyltransferase domain-containing protein [Planctomycetota bacterium]
MAIEGLNDLKAPENVKQGLETFCTEVQTALGEDLVSIILYGSIVKGEFSKLHSDVNLMVVVTDAHVDTLTKIGLPFRTGRREWRLAVMLLTENDLQRSTDVFPAKFMTIQKDYKLLVGKDVLTDLEIADAHVRLRCEQEIKNHLLRLRQAYLQRGFKPELIEGILTQGITGFMHSLATLLTLKTGDAPTNQREIVAAAAKEFDLDDQTLKDVLDLKAGTLKKDAAGLRELFGFFLTTVQTVAEIVDKHEEN